MVSLKQCGFLLFPTTASGNICPYAEKHTIIVTPVLTSVAFVPAKYLFCFFSMYNEFGSFWSKRPVWSALNRFLGVTPFYSHICCNYYLHGIITFSYSSYVVSFFFPWRLTLFISWCRRISEIHPFEKFKLSISKLTAHFTHLSRNNSHSVPHFSCLYFFAVSLM